MKTMYIPPEAVVSPRDIFKIKKIEPSLNVYFSKDVLFFKDGRSALLYGLKRCGISQGATVLIPSYVCDSVISAIRSGGLNVRFYNILSDLEPDFKDLELKLFGVKALLIIHYFGFPQPLDKITRFCKDKGLLLIEDCAHSLFSRCWDRPLGRYGNFGVFSLRKTLPLPDGGMLLLNNGMRGNIHNEKDKPSILSILSQLEKWLEFKTGISLRCYLLQMNSIRNSFIKKDSDRRINQYSGISELSLNLLRMIKEEEIVKKRRQNYQYYVERLGDKRDFNILFPVLPEGVCPIGFSILIEDRDNIRKRLLKLKINLRTFWDILPEEVSFYKYPMAYELSKRILILPVHQGLEKRHLDYTIHNLLLVT